MATKLGFYFFSAVVCFTSNNKSIYILTNPSQLLLSNLFLLCGVWNNNKKILMKQTESITNTHISAYTRDGVVDWILNKPAIHGIGSLLYFTRSWPQKFIQLKGFKFSNRAICVYVCTCPGYVRTHIRRKKKVLELRLKFKVNKQNIERG